MKLNGFVSEFLTRDVNVKSPSSPNAILSLYSNLKWVQSSKHCSTIYVNISNQISEKMSKEYEREVFENLTCEARSSNRHWMILG